MLVMHLETLGMCEDVLLCTGRLNQDARLLFLGELVSRGESGSWPTMRACTSVHQT